MEKTTSHRSSSSSSSSTGDDRLDSHNEKSVMEHHKESSSILDKYPEYASTSLLDDLRSREYGYLDEQGHLYLDYTGSGLAARSQLRTQHDRLTGSVTYGNPHSDNPTSQAATAAIEDTRRRVLDFFHASADEYAVVFTPNATGAARLVAESYPFTRGKRFVYTGDNHNSIVGFREFARRKGSRAVSVPVREPQLRVETSAVTRALSGGFPLSGLSCTSAEAGSRGLFAYPAQSNFSGVQHPLEWVDLARSRGYDVLLDAAAYVPTNALDLSRVRPDFVVVSWYKLFGFPTGVGCLIARHSALARLRRPWFAGGTVRFVTVSHPWHQLLDGAAAFEDGTLNFLSIPDVAAGIDWISKIGMGTIHRRVHCLTGHFLDRLCRLRHSNGRPMVRVYGPGSDASRDDSSEKSSEKGGSSSGMRGGTVCFNLIDAAGGVIDERVIDADAAAARISLRTGCFCNPGAGEVALRVKLPKMKLLSLLKHGVERIVVRQAQTTPRAVRVSFGLASNLADVDRFLAFVETYRDLVVKSEGLGLRGGC